jgi:hypothetical protein
VHYIKVMSSRVSQNQVELKRVKYYSTATKRSIWYRPAIAGQGAKTQNTNNVDDVRACLLARVDRSLQRNLDESDDAEARPVWTGLGPRVIKFNREVSVSHGHTSFSL